MLSGWQNNLTKEEMTDKNNEKLCEAILKGDSEAADELVSRNQGFVYKTAIEIYRSNNLSESDLGIDIDDLVQEGSLALLKAAETFDSKRKIKFLTYCAPFVRSAMADLIKSACSQFEHLMTFGSSGTGEKFERIYLDEVLPDDEKLSRINAVSDPTSRSPEEIFIEKETLRELYSALGNVDARGQTYLLYRFGFIDDIEHTLTGTAIHFRLSKSRAKRTEEQSLDALRSEMPM